MEYDCFAAHLYYALLLHYALLLPPCGVLSISRLRVDKEWFFDGRSTRRVRRGSRAKIHVDNSEHSNENNKLGRGRGIRGAKMKSQNVWEH